MHRPGYFAIAFLLSFLTTTIQARKLLGSSFGVPGTNATYDYVVVGGGNAGLTIAARLAEDFNVAVIEGGGFYQVDNGNGSVVPGLGGIQALGTDPTNLQNAIDWGFVTVPQTAVQNRRFHYARGRTLGGCTARNYMAYQRATVGSMQKWADQVGDQSYTFDNVMPYYKRTPTVTSPDLTKRFPNATVNEDFSAYDNSLNGPLRISWPNYAQPFSSWIVKALKGLGVPPIDGMTTGNIMGTAEPPFSVDPDTVERETSASSYLERYAIPSTNIQVYHQTLAKKIVFSGNKTASGVIVNTAGMTYQLNATKEVIVSGGVFQSPQLLMVSGIGPRSTLESFDIPVLSDLPGVGTNMWDHALSGTAFAAQFDTSSRLLWDPEYAEQAVTDYLESKTGPLTAPAGIIGFEKLSASYRSNLTNATLTKLAAFPDDWPEIEFIPISAYMGNNRFTPGADPDDGKNYGTIAFALISPSSRGNVSITSTDTADQPAINPNWLSDPADQEVMVAAFKRSREVWAAMSEVTIGPETYPGANITTDEQILDAIKTSLVVTYHASCTCQMGKAGDPKAVVDSKARVFGVNGLRVVDASAFPFLTPGHPQATVYMLAEKIADDIKNGR